MKKIYSRIFAAIVMLGMIGLTTTPVQAARWGEERYKNEGAWQAYIGDFTPHEDDVIHIGKDHFKDWQSYPADTWKKRWDNYNIREARFTVDDRNIYGYVAMNPKNITNAWSDLIMSGYEIKVNGKLVAEIRIADPDIRKAALNNSMFEQSYLKPGQGTYVNIEVVDSSWKHGYYRNYVTHAGYMYKDEHNNMMMEFAVPFAAIGYDGVDPTPSTLWNFNQPGALNDGKGITYEGTSTGWIVPVLSAVVFVGIGLGIVKWRRTRQPEFS
ncbi:Firmicu-CTERM sorting domain-containing protein [Ligilactobacillus saerimneri]|uniref:Firmicu-CTERM sorting domain-containing protein n=1 Tax=Ligilactobacillus saerimneri TaxID=228229 RepID=UPI001C110E35|nr:Firmicu-CTERM sorting domain-containing protein [Ligilactobacillus saerimneri]MBU5309816.1 hypothetical protein [Ligilactobacillus saerimneri]